MPCLYVMRIQSAVKCKGLCLGGKHLNMEAKLNCVVRLSTKMLGERHNSEKLNVQFMNFI